MGVVAREGWWRLWRGRGGGGRDRRGGVVGGGVREVWWG